MDSRVLIFIVVVLLVASLGLKFKFNLFGGTNEEVKLVSKMASENEWRIRQPVVSQTCVSKPAMEQMLPGKVSGKLPEIWPADNLHYFDNTELTTKLCGPAITEESLNQWKNVEKKWQEMYSEEALKPRRVKFDEEGANLRKIKFE